MSNPKTLYAATVSYRTPGGRRVLYGTVVAARNLAECAEKLRLRLRDEEKYGRRRIAKILDDFFAISFGTQIQKRT